MLLLAHYLSWAHLAALSGSDEFTQSQRDLIEALVNNDACHSLEVMQLAQWQPWMLPLLIAQPTQPR